jgi:DinB superfamily
VKVDTAHAWEPSRSMEFEKPVVYDELERVRRTFAELVGMPEPELRRASNGTRWTNRQLLFHMLFGYMVVRALFWMMQILGFLPRWATRPFAALLDLITAPFNMVNYLGSCIGAVIFEPHQMQKRLNHETRWLARRLANDSRKNLSRGMHYPSRWDPFFKGYMTLADLYRYPTQHFDFHRQQLSAGP